MPVFATESLWLNILLFLGGFWLLIRGSDRFVDSAAAIARIWKVSELIIGLTLVSIGTSLPELASSLYAVANGVTDFAFGNVIGSITTNITLILGLAVAIGAPLTFSRKLFTRDAVLMNIIFIVTIAFFCISHTHGSGDAFVPTLDWWAGVIFLIGAVAYCIYLFKHPEELCEELPEGACDAISHPEAVAPKHGIAYEFAFLVLGFAMLFAGSKILVDTVSWGAVKLGISEMVISATIIAFGTSVPELAVSVAGVLKGRHDMAIGNIIGSNIFNILLIFGACSLVTPLPANGFDAYVHLSFMMLAGIMLLFFMYTGRVLKRWEGIVLLLVYLGFLAFNFVMAK